MDQSHIRNFVITAHVDHGKSTLADRFLELTKTVEPRKMHAQYLDTMGLEQERGITIKMTPVRMMYHPDWRTEGSEFVLNLIDTPGHVDFSYEVSRALAAVEGAILLVDATKGIQAQTLANLELALEQGLTIIPAVNKIDLPQARTKDVKREIVDLLGVPESDIFEISAKEGTGVADLLAAVVQRVPPPEGRADALLRALVIDSFYDDFRGVVAHVRVVDGSVRARDRVRFIASEETVEALEVGSFRPEMKPEDVLGAGEIGYVVTGFKNPGAVRIGDTITTEKSKSKIAKSVESDTRHSPFSIRHSRQAVVEPLAGYREPQPVVYAALFPEDADDFEPLRDAIGKLRLNDAALTAAPEESYALGRGFRCGFLGTLHLEIIVERLSREFGLKLVVTHPSVVLTAIFPDGSERAVRTPRDFPEQWSRIREPWVRLEMLVPPEELSRALRVIGETRGTVEETKSVGFTRVAVRASVPLLDVIEEFADKLKSATRGYASFSWQSSGERDGDLAKLDVFVAHENIEALSQVVPRIRSERVARQIALRLKETLPAQLFAVAIQVGIGTRVIARETISALRKDVTAKLYGGDFTRKKKLLVKQRKGKKRLEKFGRVRIPPHIYLEMFRKR